MISNEKFEAMSIFYRILSIIFKVNRHAGLPEAINFIRKNYHDPNLSNKDIAKHLKINETHLNRLFVKLYNTTPKQYILKIRMEDAKRLLLEGEYSISEISQQCGYSSIYSFSRAFKDYTVQTPSYYKKSVRKNYYLL